VRPPPSPWVETFVSHLAFIAPEWELFAAACVSAGGLCLAEASFASLSPRQKFPFPARVETGSVTGWSLRACAPSGDFGPLFFASKNCAPAAGLARSLIGGGWSLIMLNERENILSALREKPLKVYEIMKRVNISNEEACQSLLLKMRDDGLIKFDIHKGRWLIG
jgi:hypothetical protein